MPGPTRGTASGGRARAADRIRLAASAQLVLEAAAQDQQASVLVGAERARHAGARPPVEAIRLVVVAGALSIERAGGTSETLLL
jgi:hypothetical protein